MQALKVDYNKRFSESINFFFILHKIEKKHVLEELNPCRGDSILEIGCNSGKFVKKLLLYCDNVVGVDVNAAAIKACNSDRLLCMNAEVLDFENGTFDKIVSMHTIEHIPNLKKAVSEMARVVKKGGKIVLSYPFELVRGITCLPTACFVYGNPMMCRQLHLHKLNRAKIERLIENTGLQIVSHRIVLTPMPVYITVLGKG